MNFLNCPPTVYVIGNEYEITLVLKSFGKVEIRVGDKSFFEEHSGALPTERTYARIRVPMIDLDVAQGYSVIFNKTNERRAYWSTLLEKEEQSFKFKPLKKREEINIYHIADVHQKFDIAKETARFFENRVDLFVFNGDLGEVETEDDYFAVCKFVGEISKGEVPVIFARGNHDARGRLAEKYCDYFPANGKKTYYTAKLSNLSILVLDLGEDKADDATVYGGYNDFHAFRESETEFLLELKEKNEKFDFAIAHIAPAHTTEKVGSEFDIEGKTYTKWNALLSEMGIKFMLSAHMHKAYILKKNSNISIRPHDFPIIVGSAHEENDIVGAALTLSPSTLSCAFTDCSLSVRESYEINFENGNIVKAK